MKRNRFDDQDDVVIHGKAFLLSQFLGLKHKCYIVLRRSADPPHVLESYQTVTSTNRKLISLKNVIISQSGRCGFDIIASGKTKHQFYIDSEDDATKWINSIRGLCTFESDLDTCSRLLVNVLPCSALSFNGQCRLVISESHISLFEINNENRQIVSWPLRTIRSYGINKDLFMLMTGRGSETGEAEFMFKVYKPLTPYHIYQEVGAKTLRPEAVNINSIRVSDQGHVQENCSVTIQNSSHGDTHINEYSSISGGCERHEDGMHEMLPDVTPASSHSKWVKIECCGDVPIYEYPQVNNVSLPHEIDMCKILPDVTLDSSNSKFIKPDYCSDVSVKISGMDTCDIISRTYNRDNQALLESICQLPSKSFLSIYGHKERERKLKNLIYKDATGTCKVLLYGPKQSGKKALANALAVEMEALLLIISCIDLLQNFDCNNVSDLKKIFDLIPSLLPCIVVLDQIDLVPSKFHDLSMGLEILNTILNLFDYSYIDERLVIVCSTNFPQNIECSLLCKMDNQIYVPLPSPQIRLSLVKDCLKTLDIPDSEKFMQVVVNNTSGFSVPEVMELCQDLSSYYTDSPSRLSEPVETILKDYLFEHLVSEPCNNEDSVKASAQYFIDHDYLQGAFLVTLQMNSVLPFVKSCFLIVTSSGLELCDLDPCCLITSWTSEMICGTVWCQQYFGLETKRSSSTGKAFFEFETNEGSRIQQLFEAASYTRQMKLSCQSSRNRLDL